MGRSRRVDGDEKLGDSVGIADVVRELMLKTAGVLADALAYGAARRARMKTKRDAGRGK